MTRMTETMERLSAQRLWLLRLVVKLFSLATAYRSRGVGNARQPARSSAPVPSRVSKRRTRTSAKVMTQFCRDVS